MDHSASNSMRPATTSTTSVANRRFWQGLFSAHDLIALSYLGVMLVLTSLAEGELRERCLQRIVTALIALTASIVIARRVVELPQTLRAQLYRIALAFVVIESYLMLRDLLPLLRGDSLDATLLAIDTQLLGVSPALWLERFNQRPVIEWFSFFYFSYFWICSAYLATVLWLLRAGRHTSVFAVGSVLVLFIGQLGYVAMPGYGPVRQLADAFQQPIDGGFFWDCVSTTVAQAGAQKDIFPSLHTALPTWFTLFAWNTARRDPRWRPVAIITGIFALNIIISTMLLRWHYAIDVVAGLCLAGFAGWLAPRIVDLEASWRKQHQLPDPWDFA